MSEQPPAAAIDDTVAGRQRLNEICLDRSRAPETRARMLLDVIHGHEDDPSTQEAVLADLLRVAVHSRDDEALRLIESYEQGINELQNGPVRPATYLGSAETNGMPGPGPRVHVVTPDGQERYPTLHSRVEQTNLKPGMTVYLDGRGAVVLASAGALPRVGQEGTFLRLVDPGLVEANLHNDRLVVHTAAPVRDALSRGEVKAGDRLLICPRRLVAFDVVPAPEDYKHRFIDQSRVPDVTAERDIGKPHWILDYLVRRVKVFLFRPDLLSSFDLRPRCSVLLTGPSGCGKTLTIRAFLNEFDQLVKQRTGRTDLGSRVVRVKVAELLSEWLGRSDKNIEELFDDIHAIAGKQIQTSQGENIRLPVVVILEEVEGLARQRARHDTVYDRILTTLLQRLDDPTEDLARLPLVLISTTNRPDLIDSAMLRRLGLHARFTRLDREATASVLLKKLRPRYPLAEGESREAIVERIERWLFGAGSDAHAVVALTLADGQELVKRRRDFLTGGVIEQAVASAIDRIVLHAESDVSPAGLSAESLIDAIRQVVDALADQLTPDNAADYLDVPENHRIQSVRRLRGRTPLLPATLEEWNN